MATVKALKTVEIMSGNNHNLQEGKNGVKPDGNGRVNGRNGSSSYKSKKNWKDNFYESFEETPLLTAILTVMCYGILVLVGHIREYLRFYSIEQNKGHTEPKIEGFVPLFQSWESFYTRNVYRRIRDCWNRPVASSAGAYIDVVECKSDDHNWSLELTEKKYHVMNFGSYNYLGFSETTGPCADSAEQCVRETSLSVTNSRQELGYTTVHQELDRKVAKFLGVEDAITFPMGFATNSMNMPCLVGKGCLLLSDELNHASLVLGSRLTGSTIRVFKHNNMADLEKKLKAALLEGRPRNHRPWKKILIVVEGVYSMEGSIVRLPEILLLKKKYKAYVYLDEAHSIGALGPHGRGVTDYFGIDPKEVDIMMGTFTKSFGAAGGYLAGSKALIRHFRLHSHSSVYSAAVPPPIAKQVISVIDIISGIDGTKKGIERINQLAWNTQYMRRRLQEMGFIVYGNKDSPVVPFIVFYPTKLASISRKALERGLGVVVVGFPATPVIEGRVRLCMSAAHTKEMLDKTLDILNQLGDELNLKYSRKTPPDFKEDDSLLNKE
ncbi:hypothetical protein SNE40_009185 [Patella caerulea]